MSEAKFKDDLTHEDGRQEGISGALLPGVNGYRRAVFAEDILPVVTAAFTAHIDNTLNDYKKIDERRTQNLKAYEGQSEKNEAITIPIVKRDSNQQLAWLLRTLFSKDPFISVKPLEAGYVQLVVEDENGSVYLDQVTTEEEAEALELLVNFYLRDKIGFKKTLRTFVTELLRDGNRPPVLKVCYEEREHNTPVLSITEGAEEEKDGRKRIRIEKIDKDPTFKKVKDGEPVRIECVPGDKFYIPLPEYDIQKSPFVFQEFEEDLATTKDKIARGIYDFCREQVDQDSEEVQRVITGVKSRDELEKVRIDGRIPMDPMRRYRRMEIWLDYPFASLNEAQPEIPAQLDETGAEVSPAVPAVEESISVEMIPFCAVYDYDSRQFLNFYENIYWHRRRPFFAGKMQERPFSFAAYSTAENVAPFQRYISQMFHLQVQNLAIANMKVFQVKRTSSAFKQMSGNGFKLRPGQIIGIDDDNDIKAEALGAPIGSIANEIGYLGGESEKMTVVNEFDRGSVPDRTPVGTVQTVQNLAKMQPAMILDSIKETISDAVKMFVQTLIQFSPTGIVIPFKGKNKALIQRTISFPREVIVDQFAFEVTATADDETPQALMTRDMMLGGEVTKFSNEAMSIAAAVWVPGVPPPFVIFGTKLILGRKRMVERLLTHAKLNPDDYLPTDQEIEQTPSQLLMLQMAIQEQNGAANGLPPTGGGSPLPPSGGGAQPAQLMEGQPDDAGSPIGGLPGTIPPGV